MATTPTSPTDTGEPPRFFRRPAGWSGLAPTSWGSVHAWLFVVFLVATFGPMFHLWAGSTRLVLGWPISMGWILACMVLQSINLVVFYFTTVKPTTRALDDLVTTPATSPVASGTEDAS